MSAPLRVSVRGLVGFSVFQPDILPVSAQLMELGRQGHLARQGQSGLKAESQLDWQGEVDGQAVRVSGRMDLYDAASDPPLIEEIKLAPKQAHSQALREHLMQAVCYGFMLAQREGLEKVRLRVSYVSPQGALQAEFDETWDAGRLEAAFFELLLPWVAWQSRLNRHTAARDQSLRELAFPYAAYRPGQREMAAQVYTAISLKKRLFAVMPTGTGKSAAALYPALKAQGQGLTLKIYCLTARGTQRIAIQKEFERMLAGGLQAHALTLNAKESLCPMEQLRCHPDHCERARGHYERQRAAVTEAFDTPAWDGDFVTRMAQKHCLCPFEYALALTETADVVICDYNYALDPQIRLSRVFDQQRKITLLVDEAHNLPDRARDMLSGALSAAGLREFRREAGRLHGRASALYKACTGCLNLFSVEDLAEQPGRIEEAAQNLLTALGTGFTPGALHLVRDLVSFLGALRRMRDEPDDYALLFHPDKTKGSLTALNLNPAPHLGEVTRRLSGCVFYSATLSPLRAMRSLLGGDQDDACLELPSPFPEDHLLTLHYKLNTRFKARQGSLQEAVQAIRALFQARPGKMIAYFPSFAYLRQAEALLRLEGLPLIVQQAGMDEAQRLLFLAAFTGDEAPLLGLCVLGGVFSEGVDLPGRALTACCAVGVGLPQVNAERDRYLQRMEEVMGDGFGFAYRYPGMHKVLQAAGRLIRSETDRGVLLLMDDRYGSPEYRELLPLHITPEKVYTIQEIEDTARAFFGRAAEGGGVLG